MAVRSQGVVPVEPAAPAVLRGVGAPFAVRVVNASVSPGKIGVAGLKVAVPAPGAKLADLVTATVPAGLPLGVGIGSARVSAPDTVEVTLICTPSAGVTLGALTVSLIIFEM